MEELVLKLNGFLEAENPVQKDFSELFMKISRHKGIVIRLLDFQYFSEESLKHTKKEKIKEIGIQNFASAARLRGKEKKIQKYIDIRNELEVSKSAFFYKDSHLLYLYLGTATNDLVIRTWFNEEIGKIKK